MDDDFVVGEAGAAVPGGLGFFTDGEHEADDVVGGEVDDLGDGGGIESDHGAGIVTHVVGGEHKGHAGKGRGTHAFVADQLILILVEGFDHGAENVLHGLGGVGPVGCRVGEVCGAVGAHDEEHAGVLDMSLIPGGRADFLLTLLVADDDEAVVLHVEGRGRQFGEADQLGEVGLRHLVVGIKVFDGAAALDCVGSGHDGMGRWNVGNEQRQMESGELNAVGKPAWNISLLMGS